MHAIPPMVMSLPAGRALLPCSSPAGLATATMGAGGCSSSQGTAAAATGRQCWGPGTTAAHHLSMHDARGLAHLLCHLCALRVCLHREQPSARRQRPRDAHAAIAYETAQLQAARRPPQLPHRRLQHRPLLRAHFVHGEVGAEGICEQDKSACGTRPSAGSSCWSVALAFSTPGCSAPAVAA